MNLFSPSTLSNRHQTLLVRLAHTVSALPNEPSQSPLTFKCWGLNMGPANLSLKGQAVGFICLQDVDTEIH